MKDGGIGFAQAVGPEHFPGKYLGVAQHDAPEGDVVAIGGALALAGGSDEFAQGFEAGAGAAIANLAVLCAGKVPVNLNFTAGSGAITVDIQNSWSNTHVNNGFLAVGTGASFAPFSSSPSNLPTRSS